MPAHINYCTYLKFICADEPNEVWVAESMNSSKASARKWMHTDMFCLNGFSKQCMTEYTKWKNPASAIKKEEKKRVSVFKFSCIRRAKCESTSTITCWTSSLVGKKRRKADSRGRLLKTQTAGSWETGTMWPDIPVSQSVSAATGNICGFSAVFVALFFFNFYFYWPSYVAL